MLIRLTLLLTLIFNTTTLFAAENFNATVDSLLNQATAAGVSRATTDDARKVVSFSENVAELAHKQPEFTMTTAEYLSKTVSKSKLERAQKRSSDHKKALRDSETAHGVPRSIIASLWAMETNCGSFMGSTNTLSALATLVHEDYRSNYFGREFVNALKIIDRGHITADKYTGSWAGATGQVQFMPSSFLSYAVDGNGDGIIDLWTSEADALSSAGNYLRKNGWPKSEFFINEAKNVEGKESIRTPLSKEQLKEHGLNEEFANKGKAYLFTDGETGYIVSEHAMTIMRWNRSEKFATAVLLMASKLAGGI